jgi:hypothetical protein
MGPVALQGCLSEDRNFQTVPKAMLALWGLATADQFTCMIHSCVIVEAGGRCSEERGDCGHPIKARVYFLAYALCICFTTIQMVVNVIISNYVRSLAPSPLLTREPPLVYVSSSGACAARPRRNGRAPRDRPGHGQLPGHLEAVRPSRRGLLVALPPC